MKVCVIFLNIKNDSLTKMVKKFLISVYKISGLKNYNLKMKIFHKNFENKYYTRNALDPNSLISLLIKQLN